jgi:cell filamentation protein
MTKYHVNSGEDEILPNLLGLTNKKDIDKAEFEGFLFAELLFMRSLTNNTRFNIDFIKNLHFEALKELYSFAGELRSVNISKAGFLFPAAQFLNQSMHLFGTEILNNLPKTYKNEPDLISDIAKVHAELLFIHPFREGNGRTARILADLMSYKEGHGTLEWEKINNKIYPSYVAAVQSAAKKNYQPMVKIIELVF